MLLAAAAAAVSLASAPAPALALKPCAVQSVRARCGVMAVPENPARPHGRQIGLRVVVVPAMKQPVAPDAVTYLAGGPGVASTDETSVLVSQWPGLLEHHDLLLVDQRGTGVSNSFTCPKRTTPFRTKAELRAYSRACLKSFGGDITRYGTRTAMDDLDAVRAALGYRQLDVVGGSYGATAAQVYLKEHPSSVRTLVLAGATALDVPFYGRWAIDAQRSLDRLAALCSADPSCRKAFPHWTRQLAELVKAWNAHPVHNRRGETTTGNGLAGTVQSMLIDVNKAVSIPLLVSRAAKGDYGPLNRQLTANTGNGEAGPPLMFWSIWCNEPWVGLEAKGPWGTVFDGVAAAQLAQYRQACAFVPKRAEQRALWSFPSSTRVPVLVLAGGADPQDPITNLPDLRAHFPDSRAVILPYQGHQFSTGSCVGELIADVVEHRTTRGLRPGLCTGSFLPPPFPLTG